MIPVALPISLSAAAPSMVQRLGRILASLSAVIPHILHRQPGAICGGRAGAVSEGRPSASIGSRPGALAGTRLLATLQFALWVYIRRVATRFDRLVARVIAGTPLRQTRPSAATGATAVAPGDNLSSGLATAKASSGSRKIRLPQGHAWIVYALGYHAAGYASQLRHLLGEPDMAEFLAANPQAVRLLRPLCRMLGVITFDPPPDPKPARAPKPPRVKPEPPAYQPTLHRRPSASDFQHLVPREVGG